MTADLVCPVCGRAFPAGPEEPWRCPCGGPLELDSTPSLGERPQGFDRDRGLWAFQELLPGEPRVTLGEGFTPLVDAPAWGAQFKLEYVFPSGSFKDRGATTTLSRAAALGVERVIEDSSGNAGAAIALYAARAGIEASIYVPDGTKSSKLAAIEGTGATVHRVPGSREAAGEAAREAVEGGAGWYASHAWNPAFYAGTATAALEIAVQRDFSVPDTVITPLGHGTLFLGLARGFDHLRAAGWTDAVPSVVGVQAAGSAPIAAAVSDPPSGSNTLADGIQIASPARRDQLEAVAQTGENSVIAVDAEETREAHRRLHRAGFHVEPTAAVAVAGLKRLRERARPLGETVLALTGSGLKNDPGADRSTG